MSQRKKIIYIIIIVMCSLGSVGVIYFSQNAGTDVPEVPIAIGNPDNALGINPQGGGGQTGEDITFSPPSVFPNDTKFDMSIFESDKYKQLQPGQSLGIAPSELGKPNPFLE